MCVQWWHTFLRLLQQKDNSYSPPRQCHHLFNLKVFLPCQQGNKTFFMSSNRTSLIYMYVHKPPGEGDGPLFAPLAFNNYFIDLSFLPWGSSGKTSHFVRSSQTACWRFYLGKRVTWSVLSATSRLSLTGYKEMAIKIEWVSLLYASSYFLWY